MLFLVKHAPLENKVIEHILREYPQMSEVMPRYFGEHCLKRPGFKMKTLEMACILSGVDPKRFMQEFQKIQN